MPVIVEARMGLDGTIVPLAIVREGRRQGIAALSRQWEETHPEAGHRTFYDVGLERGGTVLLCLERSSLRWYIVGAWTEARMA